jgi:hypothetical protein
VPLGALDPEAVVTPGIFVQRVVQVQCSGVHGAVLPAAEAAVEPAAAAVAA